MAGWKSTVLAGGLAPQSEVDQGAQVSTSLASELDDRWILNLGGLSVSQIAVDFRLTLAMHPDWKVMIGAPADLSQGPERTESDSGFRLVPEAQDVASALVLFNAKILSAAAFKNGTLRIVFDNGLRLVCRSNPAYEAWEVCGPSGWLFVSVPGGRLAVWSGHGEIRA